MRDGEVEVRSSRGALIRGARGGESPALGTYQQAGDSLSRDLYGVAASKHGGTWTESQEGGPQRLSR